MRLLPQLIHSLLISTVLWAASVGAQQASQWNMDDWYEVTGDIVELNGVRELELDAQGQRWVVQVGEPWRNQRAGLDGDQLSQGRRVTVYGYPSTAKEERRVKAVRLVIDGRNYDLYPGQIR